MTGSKRAVGALFALLVVGLSAASTSLGQAQGGLSPTRQGSDAFQGLLDQTIEGSRLGSRQEVRVFTTILAPGEKVERHYHPGIVTFYVLEGAFTVEFPGQPPKTVTMGRAMVEPPYVPHTGYNPSATERAKLLNIYVSNPGAPFMVAVH